MPMPIPSSFTLLHYPLMATNLKLFFSFFLCSSIFLLIISGSEGAPSHNHHHHHEQPKKLFVFGDSYADTGNSRLSQSSSWKVPYGFTFPGKPTGRFSDGRVFTDFIARVLGSKSPLPYRWRKYTPQNLKYGINFAYGGTGVFNTLAPYPNMTTQIDLFQQFVKENKFISSWDIQNSAALVSLAGNDYSTYLTKSTSNQGLKAFIPEVVNQLALNLQRLYSFGVKKIAVTALPPLGCLPRSTSTNWFQQCNTTSNQAVMFHNLLLQQAVAKLNNETHGHGSPFIILDLYNAFLSIFQQNGAGSLRFDSPLKPCCLGVNQNYSCGSMDAWGNKKYTMCSDPKSSFFWDSVHPTEAGWHAVHLALLTNLEKLISK